MLRVLMVLEDYGELMFLQAVLKKIGFDVDAIQNPRSFEEGVLRMNPDVLVMTALGKRVNGLELSRGLRRVRGTPRVILIHAQGTVTPEGESTVDVWVQSPVGALDLIDHIADYCGLNKPVLQEKFQKLQIREIEENVRVLKLDQDIGPSLEKSADGDTQHSGRLTPSTLKKEDREERYRKFMSGATPPKDGFSVKDVQAKIRELREAERPEDLEDLERERREFVEHLFRNKA